MFKIVASGMVIAICDAPRYITKDPDNGCFVEADPESATGVAVGGTPYNLPGHEDIEDAPTAYISEVDGGEFIFQAQAETRSEVAAVNGYSAIAFVTMAQSGQIDPTTAAEHTDLFTPWAYPVAYKKDDVVQYGGKLYQCVQPHTSQADWTPEAYQAGWKNFADPTVEWPEWSRPIGAHDAYGKGDKVSHNDHHWTSDLDANVWEPGQYGWTQADE